MHDDAPDFDRREFIRLASSVGLAAAAPQTVAEVARAAEQSNKIVDIPHVSQRPGVQERVEKYKSTGEPSAKYEQALQRTVDARSEPYDLLVRTEGTSETETTTRYGVEIRGWRPTFEEIRILYEHGDLGFTPDFTSTTVSVRSVSEDDLEALAGKEWVHSIGSLDPEPVDDPVEHTDSDLDGEPVPLHDTASAELSIANAKVSNFYGASDHYDFEDSAIRCGVVDRGYYGTGELIEPETCPTDSKSDSQLDEPLSGYSQAFAEEVIDTDLARNFTDGREECTWKGPTDNRHADIVADTLASLLDDPPSDLIVPLRANAGYNAGHLIDNIREAIEYALRHDIEVLNISLGSGYFDSCPAIFCQDLWAYAEAGYVAVATSGNEPADHVRGLGGSKYSVAVGAVTKDECGWKHWREPKEDDEDQRRGTSYGTVDYSDCPYCSDHDSPDRQFVPDVYAVGEMYTPQSSSTTDPAGTSYAAPQVTANAVMMQSNGLYDFWSSKDLFHKMTEQTVCQDDAAQRGELLDAEYGAWASEYIASRYDR